MLDTLLLYEFIMNYYKKYEFGIFFCLNFKLLCLNLYLKKVI